MSDVTPPYPLWTEARYDGTFDLTFLREGESVHAVGDATGACWVEQVTGPGEARGMRLDLGDTLARQPDGSLFSYTPTPACECGHYAEDHGGPRNECRYSPHGTGPGCRTYTVAKDSQEAGESRG